MIDKKILIRKNDKRKTNNNQKHDNQNWYKNQILRDKIEKKILKKYNNKKIKDQIWYNQQIIT